MAFNLRKFFEGIRIIPKSTSTVDTKGELEVLSSDGKINYHNGTTSSKIITESHASQGANRLQNKDLEDSSTQIVDASDVTKKILFDAAGTTGTSTSIISSQTTNKVLTLPDITDTLVSKNTNDSLTNKTLTGSTNTISIHDANLTIQDNIDNTKQLKLEVSGISPLTTRTLTAPDENTTIVGTNATQTLSNKTFSDEVRLAEIALPLTPTSGTGKLYFKPDGFLYQLNDDGTESKVGTDLTTDINYIVNFDSESDGPGASSEASGWVMYADAASVSPTDGANLQTVSGVNTGSDELTVAGHGYSDGNVVQFQSLGTLPGGISPILQYYIINSAVNTFKISRTLSGPAVDLTSSGSGVISVYAKQILSSSVNITSINTVPIRGSRSFNLAHDSSNQQGKGVSYAFQIDPADQGRVLSLSFDYKMNSAFYVDGDIRVYIYDITNAIVIEPSTYLLQNSPSICQTFQATFQTATNSVNYRLILHQASTTSLSIPIVFDQVVVGPNKNIVGTVIQSPARAGFMMDYSGGDVPAGWLKCLGQSVSTSTYADLFANIQYTWGGAGASFNLPDFQRRVAMGSGGTQVAGPTNTVGSVGGHEQLQSHNHSTSNTLSSGAAGGHGHGITDPGHGHTIFVAFGPPNTTQNTIQAPSAITNGINLGVGAGGTGISVNGVGDHSHSLSGSVTVNSTGSGNAENVQPSAVVTKLIKLYNDQSVLLSEAELQVVAARIGGDPASAAANNPIIFPTVAYDTHQGYNTSTGQYQAPISGFIKVHGYIESNDAGVFLDVYVNNVNTIRVGKLDANGDGEYNGTVQVNAGDLVDLRPGVTLDAHSQSTIHFERMAGPTNVGVIAGGNFYGNVRISGNLGVGGTPPAATTQVIANPGPPFVVAIPSGSLVSKLQIFDKDGNSLGYIPIYTNV